jgi:hypothetical protein
MLTLFSGSPDDDDNRQEFIQSIARSVCNEAMTQLSSSASAMPIDELRGYVRTRAHAIAAAHTRKAMLEHRMPPTREAEFMAAVLDRAVHLAVRSFYAAPIASLPTPHVQIRKAA